MRSKGKLEEDSLSDDLEIISISNKKQVRSSISKFDTASLKKQIYPRFLKLAFDLNSQTMNIKYWTRGSFSIPSQVKVKRKILLFHENHRPPYCGSWRKKSTLIRARRPLAQDKTQLEYEYDSDEDWEEVRNNMWRFGDITELKYFWFWS